MLLFPTRATGAFLLITGLALQGAAQAQTAAAEPASLTLGQAVERALAGNPALQGFAYTLQAQDARIAAAGQRPATEASFELENFLGSGDYDGLDAAEATFALSQVVELGDKRRLRTAAAEAGRDLLSIERQAAQLDVLAEVARRFIHVAALQEQLELTISATALAGSIVADVERRVQAARSPEAELLRAQAALATAEIDERHARRQLAVGRRQLAATWGAEEDAFGPIKADLYRFPADTDFPALVERLDANPDFLRFASEARLRDAELRLASSLSRPDLSFSAGVRRIEGPDDQALVFGVSVPLFSGQRAAPARAEASALRELVSADRQTATIRARNQLFQLHQELQQAVAETRTLQTEVMPRLDQALKQTRYAYERGRYSYLELVDAQQAWRAAHYTLIDAAERGQTLQVEIERLTGESLETATGLPGGSESR
ncbi:MAG: TolC family protein [Gammaproteobacteria bacterium]|nr:TolC family protein [Gammaproteobacteria bacterium]